MAIYLEKPLKRKSFTALAQVFYCYTLADYFADMFFPWKTCLFLSVQQIKHTHKMLRYTWLPFIYLLVPLKLFLVRERERFILVMESCNCN